MTPDDIADIAAWGASTVVTLMPSDELDRLGIGNLQSWTARHSMMHQHAPIQDFGTPGPIFQANWPSLCQHLRARLDAGERVLVHCRGGHGRSGTIVAALLVDSGLATEDAISMIRRVRPGAIETPGQEDWLRTLEDRNAGPG